MFYNPYTLWQMYIAMRTIHGIYITYSFFSWFLGSTSATFLWMMSFFYTSETNPHGIKQIEDKKYNLDEID
tara:strand:+ start:945 stop:1157 length:213 start_codon:yes stop_codon:yes gene_type:complete